MAVTLTNKDGTPLNLTGGSVKCQIKRNSSSSVLLETTETIVDAANGKINIYINAAATGTVTEELNGRYDILFTNSLGVVTKILEGAAQFKFYWPLNNLNVTIGKGETWAISSLVKNIDNSAKNLSGYTATCTVRKVTSTSSVIAATATTLITLPNTVVVSLTPEQTFAMTSGNYVYDVYLDNGVEAFKFLGGDFQVEPAITI